MAYTAIESMRKMNEARFGTDLGPSQPALTQHANPNDLKSAALRFLHERCEGLLFDSAIAAEEAKDGVCRGKSLSAGQIPYNMQMDLNRLCLEKSLEAFIDSGVAEDAYTVYYCYLEMFLGRYGNSKRMVELLSEYESNGSSLLMKHRDHYSHSVYVFALGLAIYETNEAYRRKFRAFYELEASADNEAANLFLEFWGLTALFHGLGSRDMTCDNLMYCGERPAVLDLEIFARLVTYAIFIFTGAVFQLLFASRLPKVCGRAGKVVDISFEILILCEKFYFGKDTFVAPLLHPPALMIIYGAV